MKKLILSAAALMLATAFSFAGTPETKEEAKAKPEVKTETASITYHFDTPNPNGTINFSEGPSNSCPSGVKNPCVWTSTVPLVSPMTPAAIDSHPNVTVSSRRN